MTIDYSHIAESILTENTNIKIPVTGDSMSPLLRTGDTIYVEPVKAGDLSAGDILVYKTRGNMVAHRLVRVLRSSGRCMFLTKGDTFSFIDSPVRESDIIGRAYAVGKHGMKLNMKKGIFAVVNRLSYILSPLSSFLYGLRRRHKGFDVSYDAGMKPNEEMFISALLKVEFSEEKPDSELTAMLKECADLSKVHKLARENGISQKLYTIIKKLQDNNTLEFRTENEIGFLNKMKNDYLFTAAKNTLLYSEFRRVADSFRDEKIDLMAMKGAALAELAYRDIGTRSMSDIDLLIKKQDLEKTDALFKGLGYTAADTSPFDIMDHPNNYLTTRDYRSSNPAHPSFHLHWHMVNSSVPAPYSAGIDMNDIWEDAVSVEIAGAAVLSMSPHHFLLHLTEHAMRVTHSASRLLYFMDIAALIKSYGQKLDWHKAVRAGKDYGVDIFMRNVLKLTHLNTGIDVPEWVMDSLKEKKRTLGERLFFNITARGSGISGLSYLVHMGMNKGLLKKASLILRTLFPPAWVLAKRHPDSPGRTPAKFYFYRFKEVLSSVILSPVQKLRNICLILMFCMSVSTASSVHASEPPVNVTEIEQNNTYTMEAGIPEYLIAPEDVLEIRIWRGFEEKKHEVTVKPDGYIMVAYVSIKVADKTVRQAEAELNEALLEYIRKPRVEILIKEYRGRTITLLGAIQSQGRPSTGPGIYPLRGKTTLSQLIITAGGFTKDAKLENVRIKKTGGTTEAVNLFEIMFGSEVSNDVIVDSGDTIYIPYKADEEESSIFVLGEIRKPGVYKLTPDLTLLQALVKAGGYKEVALIDEIRIIRGGLDNPQFILADTEAIVERGDMTKNVFLQDKDIIYIPKTKIGNWNAFLKKMRPTLEFLTLPFVGVSQINDMVKEDD